MPNKGPKAGTVAPKRNITGTIDKTPAQLEAERRYEQSKANPQPSSFATPWIEEVLKNETAKLEDQRRYDSSGTLPEDARYKAPDTTLRSAAAGALRNAGARTNPPAGTRNSGGGSVGSSSSGGGAVPTAAPTLAEQLAAIQNVTGTIDPRLSQYVPNEGKLKLMYGQFDTALNRTREELTKSYEESINSIKGNYANSTNMLNAAAGADQSVLQQAAANLGVQDQYAASPVNQNLSEALNRFVGTNAGNQAIDLAWFEKLKNLDDSNLTNWLAISDRDERQAIQDSSNRMQELQLLADEQARALATQQLMDQLAALGGGGSGGGGGGGYSRRSRGGGGSSPKDTYANIVENAELDAELDYVGLTETLAALPPNLQQMAVDYWVKGGATGQGAAKAVLAAMENMGPKPAGLGVTLPGYVDPRDNNPFIRPGSYQSYTNTGVNSGQLNQIYQALLQYVPGLAPIQTAQTTDASRRTSRSYDETPYVPPRNPTGPGLFGLNPPAPKPTTATPQRRNNRLSNAIGRRVRVS